MFRMYTKVPVATYTYLYRRTHSSTKYMYLATGTATAPALWKHKASGAQADGGTDTKSDPFQNCIHCFRSGVSSPDTPSPLHSLSLSLARRSVLLRAPNMYKRTYARSSKCIMYVQRSPIFKRSRRRREDVWGDCKSFANVYRHEFSVHNCCNGWDKTFAWPCTPSRAVGISGRVFSPTIQ